MTTIYVDRSRVEEAQRCKRLRWLTYHEQGMGIVPRRKPLPLAVGGSMHAGLATLLTEGQKLYSALNYEYFKRHGQEFVVRLRSVEEEAVRVALADFAAYQAELDVDTAEQYAMEPQQVEDPQLMAAVAKQVAKGRSEFEQYLYAEQSALVEALVRAYARRRLIPLLEQYEVLEVEREGQWLLSEWNYEQAPYNDGSNQKLDEYELWFMSRPDALLLDRQSRELYILSFKSAAKWDRRKAEDAKRDMQGLSEGVEVEKRLGEWWQKVHEEHKVFGTCQDAVGMSRAQYDYLSQCSAAPRILGIRYEYILKGSRWEDKDLSARLGLPVWSQRSPLIRGYQNSGMASGDEQWNVSWEYVKETGEPSKLYYKTWHSRPVFESMPIKQWIDMLDESTEAVGEEGVSRGWASPAQTTGFLTAHPLDELFIPPIIIFRQDDELRDWIEQVESQERQIAESVAKVNSAIDEGERRHLLNTEFVMHRRSCEYPSTCAMVKICWGGAEIRRDPLGSGLFKIRTPNHPIENNTEIAKGAGQ